MDSQVEEVEALQAIYGQALVIDEENAANIAFLRSMSTNTVGIEDLAGLGLPLVKFQLKLQPDIASSVNDSHILILNVTLPTLYPSQSPVLLCNRCEGLTREKVGELNARLQQYMQEEHSGEVCIFAAAQWLLEHSPSYFAPQPPKSPAQSFSVTDFTREFVYFHHIYNKEKRKCLVQWASDLGVSGFSVPGKPGLVCAEGDASAVRQYLQDVRRLPWQKMQSKVVQSFLCSSERKFEGFRELTLDYHGHNSTHVDMGHLRSFFVQHGLETVFSSIYSLSMPAADEPDVDDD